MIPLLILFEENFSNIEKNFASYRKSLPIRPGSYNFLRYIKSLWISFGRSQQTQLINVFLMFYWTRLYVFFIPRNAYKNLVKSILNPRY
jgi:hypothetical protein